MKNEIWKIVPSLPAIEVSSFGRIRALPKSGFMPNGGERIYGGRERSFGLWDGKRYIYCYRKKTYKVARLICEAFNGKPNAGQVCMHLDENSKNNVPQNLRWGTQKENLNAPKFLNYCKTRVGNKSPVAIGRQKKKAA